MTLGQIIERLDADVALDASARVNTRDNVCITFDQKVEHTIQEIVDSNFELYKHDHRPPSVWRGYQELPVRSITNHAWPCLGANQAG